MSKADSIKPKQINKVLLICELMKNSECKKCVLVLSHSAMRVTEIALLEVKSILFPNGKIKTEIHLPSKICKGLKPRSIWLSDKSRSVIQSWIDYRIKMKWGLSLHSKIESGIKTYWACDSLEQMIRIIYKRCGLPQCSSHTGRKSLTSNSVIGGVSLEQLARMLGHSSVDTTIKYVVIDESRIKTMLAVDWI